MPINRNDAAIRLQLIQYWISWLANGFATGKWDSFYLGRGFEFQGVAPFREDPDMVRINWQATLIEGELQVSQFNEERDIRVSVLGDMSPSMAFGSQISKLDRLALLSAALSFSTLRMKDSFRFIGYTDQIETRFPETRGKTYPILLAQTIMGFDWQGKKNGGMPLAAVRIPNQRSLVILISDFLGDLWEIERTLTILASRHEILPLIIWDEREVALPKGFGLYPLCDLETGETSFVFLTPRARRKFAENSLRRRKALENLFGRFGIAPLFLTGGNVENDIDSLMKVFLIRRSRI